MSLRSRRKDRSTRAEEGATPAEVQQERLMELQAKVQAQQQHTAGFVHSWRQALWKVALALLALSGMSLYQALEKGVPLQQLGPEIMSALIALDIFRIGFGDKRYTPLNLVLGGVVAVVFVALWATAADPLSAGVPLAGKKWPIGPTLLLIVLSCEWYMQRMASDMDDTLAKSQRLTREDDRKDL